MTGKTVDEAVEAACTSLDLSRDEVSVEVLEMPQKRIFGSTLAKVRVYANTDSFTMSDILSTSEDEDGEEYIETEIEIEEVSEQEEEIVINTIEEILIHEEPIEPEQQETIIELIEEFEPEAEPLQSGTEKELVFDELPISAQAAYLYFTDISPIFYLPIIHKLFKLNSQKVCINKLLSSHKRSHGHPPIYRQVKRTGTLPPPLRLSPRLHLDTRSSSSLFAKPPTAVGGFVWYVYRFLHICYNIRKRILYE